MGWGISYDLFFSVLLSNQDVSGVLQHSAPECPLYNFTRDAYMHRVFPSKTLRRANEAGFENAIQS